VREEPPGKIAWAGPALEQLGPCRLVEALGAGAMGTVWRAAMVEDRPWAPAGATVAVKILHASSWPDDAAVGRFAREAAVGSGIDHPAVVRTFAADSITIEGQTWHYLVLEYVQGKTVRQLMRELGTLPEPLVRHLGSRVALALGAVHAAGAVHRDVKPENVLITPEQVVKLMDFGIARGPEGDTVTSAGVFVGTPRYASPEQRLGLVLTAASDLYSLGVMLFESVTGRPPADSLETSDMATPLASSINPEVSPFLDEILAHLLVPNPRDRFGSAVLLAETLEQSEASAWWREVAASRGLSGTRRPQIPVTRVLPMTGRDEPLHRLQQAVDRARAGHGGLVLVEGEAGSGKSRLIAELVASLEAEPVHVLYGSSPPGGVGPGIDALASAVVQHFGSVHLAQGIARQVASRGVVPALVALLSGSSPPESAQPLSPDILPGLFSQLARGLATQRPVVWIVEDLHFASPLGRAIVTALGHVARDQRLLVLATARPGLPEEDMESLQRQGGAERIVLERLHLGEIRAILRAAFDSDTLADQLASRVADKSDGNPLFVSALVDELRVQGLGAPSEKSLSAVQSLDQISVPSSISAMLVKRLRELGEGDRTILDAASVQGFEFDGALVARTLGRDRLDVLQALAGLARRHGVVRPRGALFTFDHHLLQELLYGQMPAALATEYHAALAVAHMESRGLAGRPPDEIPGEDAVFLANHLLMGGRSREGADFVLAAFDHLASSAQITSVLGLADLASQRAGTEPGVPPPAFDSRQRARWYLHLGDAHWTSGRFTEADAGLEAALAELGVKVPATDLSRKLFLVRQALTQVSHLMLPRALVIAGAGRRAALREAARTASLMAMMQVYRSRALDTLLFGLLAVNLAGRAGTEAVFSLGLVGFTASSLRLRGQARRYFARAREAGRKVHDRRELIQAMKFEAVDLYGQGLLDDSAARVAECLELSRDLGYSLGSAEAHGMAALLLEARGRLDEAEAECLLPLTSAECEVSGGHRFFYEHRLARLCLFQGRVEDAAAYVAAGRLSVREGDRLSLAMLRGVEAWLAVIRGDHTAATAAALEAGTVLNGHESGVPSPCRGALEDPAEALVTVWERSVASGRGDIEALARDAGAAVTRVARFARLHPVVRPSALVLDARADFLRGEAARARGKLDEAARIAHRMGMAGDEARARHAGPRR
jgi:Protein kinase domain/AAA ATPase domain